jgi:thymidine kinase
MKSGKSLELLRRAERAFIAKQSVIILRPETDTREYISRNFSVTLPILFVNPNDISKAVMNTQQSPEQVRNVYIDEGQFFPNIARDVLYLKLYNINITIAALNGTAMQTPWPAVQDLIPIVDDITFEHAVCSRCGAEAAYSLFNDGSEAGVTIGDANYEAVCRDCLIDVRCQSIEYD